MVESGASGDGGGESGVEAVVREREMGERRETAEGSREWTGEIGVREVYGSDRVCEIVAEDACPVAWSGVMGRPVGERVRRVREMEFGLEKKETFLVERESGRDY
ncbi:receptor protein kinase HSL1 [Trifolium repens]|jgi:hypothetical protein|nr:receptor protein kinase HSL1 [Trifolium repens]